MDNRKKQKTYRFKLFSCLDVNAVSEYLEDMSAKGWIFTGYKGFFMAFEKGEPSNRRYNVELFHNGSFFENDENDATYSYISEMAAEGWEFLDANGRQYIFASDHEDAKVMQRAPEDEFRNVRKCLMNELIFLPAIALLCGFNFYKALDTSWPTEFIEYGNFHLMWLFLMIFLVMSFIRTCIFCIKNKLRVSKGQAVDYPSKSAARCFNRAACILIFLAAVLLCTNAFLGEVSDLAVLAAGAVVIVFVGMLLMRFLWGGSGKVRQIIAVAVFGCAAVAVIMSMVVIMPHFGSNSRTIEYYDEDGDSIIESVTDDVIPLTVEDIGIDTDGMIRADTVCDRYASVFGTVTDCWQQYYKGHEGIAANISYNIAKVRFAWVKERLINEYLTDDYYDSYSEFENVTGAEAVFWGAESVFSSVPEYGGYARLVIYEDTVLFIINSDVEYTEDVIEIVKTKLADEF